MQPMKSQPMKSQPMKSPPTSALPTQFPKTLSMPSIALRASLVTCAICLVPSSCTVGPEFKAPESSANPAWSSLDGTSSAPSKPIATSADIARWWTAFNDPMLTSLVERATAGNLEISAAEARMRAARARRAITGGAQLPSVEAHGLAGKQPNFNSTSSPFIDNDTLFAAGFDASWEIDIFGRTRRAVEASDADVAIAEFDLRDVQVSLAGEVATNYLRLRAAQEQIGIISRNIETEAAAYEVAEKLHASQLVTSLDVSRARALLEETRSRKPIFESSARDAAYTLGVLLGGDPSSLLAELAPIGQIPAVPAEIPVGLPSELLQRRPDIRRAEAALHAATARIGVAVAEQFPRLSLGAAIGTRNSDSGDFAGLATNYWSAGGAVTAPIFEGGRIKANIELQKSLTDSALAEYRQVVLLALREVEVAITDFTQEQARRAALDRAVVAGTEAVALANALYAVGRTNFIDVLAAQRDLLDNEEALARSEQLVGTNLVALYKSLGGGWSIASAGE